MQLISKMIKSRHLFQKKQEVGGSLLSPLRVANTQYPLASTNISGFRHHHHVELIQTSQLKLMSSPHAHSPLQGCNSLLKCFVMLDDAQLLSGTNPVALRFPGTAHASSRVTGVGARDGNTLLLQGLADEWQLCLVSWLALGECSQIQKKCERKALVVTGKGHPGSAPVEELLQRHLIDSLRNQLYTKMGPSYWFSLQNHEQITWGHAFHPQSIFHAQWLYPSHVSLVFD